MGEVWLAQDTRLERQVALKMVRADGDPHARASLMKEARAAAALNHPHIATVHDVLEHDGEIIVVFEYVQGETLHSRIARGAIAPQEAVEIAMQVTKALVGAHAAGIVHRDLKPANVIIGAGGHVKVLDFGIARILSRGTTQTNPAAQPRTNSAIGFVGTASYAAPEQMVSSSVDERADLYSLGVVLFEMITGQKPFAGSDPVQLATKKLGTEAPKLSSTGRLVPPLLEQIVASLLERDRDNRLASAAEVLGQLKHVFGGDSTIFLKPKARGTRVLAIAAAVVIAVVGGFGAWRWGATRDTAARPGAPPVIAVLPLTNVSGDPSREFVAAGIAESLIASLATIPSVTVLSRTSVTEAKNRTKDTAALTRDLGANYMVEGSVQESSGRLKISLTLVKSADRSVAWGNTLEGTFDQIFDLQSRLASALTSALVVRVSASELDRMNQRPTSDPQALSAYWQGRALLDRRDLKGSLEGAVVSFTRAVELDPRFALAHAALGEAYWLQYVDTRDANWAQKATAEGTAASTLDPQEPAVRFALAVTLAGTGKYAEAIEELRAALTIRPNYDDARRQLGLVLAQIGQIDQSIVELRRAIALRPEFWGHYSALGTTLLQAGKYDEAIAAFQKVIELQPDNFFGYQQLGVVHHNLGHLDDALRFYNLALDRRPNAQAFSNIGAIHHRRGEYDQAVSAYRDAINLRPNSHITYRNLGDALRRMGQDVAAREAYSKAVSLAESELKVNPNDAGLMSFLALYFQKAGREADARIRLDQALKAAKVDWQVSFRAAEVYALAQRPNDALALMRLALEQGAPRSRLQEEEDFEGLHSLPQYQKLVGAELQPSR